jgi:hypothetical protein
MEYPSVAHFDEVHDRVWLGPKVFAEEASEELASAGITHVLNITVQIAKHEDRFTYYSVNEPDSEYAPLVRYFDSCATFVEDALAAGGAVYICCDAGISRSPTVLMFVLMSKFGLTLEEAYNKIVAKRPIIKPRLSFFRDLVSAEMRLRGSCSFTFDDYALIHDSMTPLSSR